MNCWARHCRVYALFAAVTFWPALSFAQNIFIDHPREGETLNGPTVTLRVSTTDFQLGDDGRIRIAIDGAFVGETDRYATTLFIGPGTHQFEVWLVDLRSKIIDTTLPETVKFTVTEPSL